MAFFYTNKVLSWNTLPGHIDRFFLPSPCSRTVHLLCLPTSLHLFFYHRTSVHSLVPIRHMIDLRGVNRTPHMFHTPTRLQQLYFYPNIAFTRTNGDNSSRKVRSRRPRHFDKNRQTSLAVCIRFPRETSRQRTSAAQRRRSTRNRIRSYRVTSQNAPFIGRGIRSDPSIMSHAARLEGPPPSGIIWPIPVTGLFSAILTGVDLRMRRWRRRRRVSRGGADPWLQDYYEDCRADCGRTERTRSRR